ncbi:MAG TPA: hypothetical protein ENK61_05405, partial [Devosia sp.]|nr:hypothetical protein [Devosia sp.]
MNKISTDDNLYRPWIDNYPEGITWNGDVDTTPVHELVLAACKEHANSDALDFLGAKTSFRSLGHQ